MKKTFDINLANGWIHVNTLSPSENYYYKLQEPTELNKSAFGCKIAFYDIENELLYHRKNHFAHELHTKEETEEMIRIINEERYELLKKTDSIELVKWSIEGNMAFFIEYFASIYGRTLEIIFLNLKNKYCYRINESEYEFSLISKIRPIDETYEEKKVEEFMNLFEIEREPLIIESIGIREWPFFKKKWYPNI